MRIILEFIIGMAYGDSSRDFLPTCRGEMSERGWDQLDVLLVSGDAYVDHPSFGVPLLGRLLETEGYRVGIVAQPRWDVPTDVVKMGRPRLFCGISAGSLDSMVAHYTAFRKKRHDDAYTPGGKAGARPNRATIVYSNIVRQVFPGLPVVLGGIEASLRRTVHYDFWSDSLRRSVLLDSRAELVLYGMAEKSVVEVAGRIDDGRNLSDIRGSAIVSTDPPPGAGRLPSLPEIEAEPSLLVDAAVEVEKQVHRCDRQLIQPHANRYVLLNPPQPSLATEELDALYELPFTRKAHPRYGQRIPALDMVKWSITSVRGCGGACTFCALSVHQGRRICSRSSGSICSEAARLTRMDAWRGSISDIGGPTANLWGSSCSLSDPDECSRDSCLFPRLCGNLDLTQGEFLGLLRKVRNIPGVEHVRVSSGIRHDLALAEPAFVRGLVAEFVGGQLKLAPEHCVGKVLQTMRKTEFSRFEHFLREFESINRSAGTEQYIVPYLMSGFPGCTLDDMEILNRWFRSRGWHPRQVQCFIPTPGTVASGMYYAECDLEGNPIHVAKTDSERLAQHGKLFQNGRHGRKKRGGGRGR